MDYSHIRLCLGNCRFTDHARREMAAESLGVIQVDELLEAIASGEVIEDYPDDQPYPSCLVFGRAQSGRPLHVVCAPVLGEMLLIIITTYEPDPAKWEVDLKKRKRS